LIFGSIIAHLAAKLFDVVSFQTHARIGTACIWKHYRTKESLPQRDRLSKI